MDVIESIECISSSDGMEDDDAMSSNLPRPFLKASAAAISIGVVPGGGGGAFGAGAVPGPLIPPATSVHELLECPVCTNSMYPPIHQGILYMSNFELVFKQWSVLRADDPAIIGAVGYALQHANCTKNTISGT